MPAESLDATLLSAASPWSIPVQVVDEITSSNDSLLQQGEEGAPSGTLLFAESQTSGRGQFRRSWNSARGLGLWFSLLLRLEINDASIPSLSAFAAVALVNTIRELGIEGAGIKAPNDVLIGGHKVAGILVETRVGKNPFAVIGIGLNVKHRRDDFPEELREQATSLALASDKPFNRSQVAAGLLRHLGEQERLMHESKKELLASWKRHLFPSQDSKSER
jgi:BirA family biotin operon repressor/biotin-[acetyl-CoA-carboxylase] ligase